MPNNGNSNVINIKTLMKENAFVEGKNKARKYLKISPESIQEMKKRIIEALEDNTPHIASIADNDGRSTIMTRHYHDDKPDVCDVTMHFCLVESKIINEFSDRYLVVEKKSIS